MTRVPLKLPAIAAVAAVPLILLCIGSAPASADDVESPGPAPVGVEVGPEVEIGPAVEVGRADDPFVQDLVDLISEG